MITRYVVHKISTYSIVSHTDPVTHSLSLHRSSSRTPKLSQQENPHQIPSILNRPNLHICTLLVSLIPNYDPSPHDPPYLPRSLPFPLSRPHHLPFHHVLHGQLNRLLLCPPSHILRLFGGLRAVWGLREYFPTTGRPAPYLPMGYRKGIQVYNGLGHGRRI